MSLYRVTLSGADESVSVSDMRELTQRYPFVEWGILFSEKKQGQEPRYPYIGDFSANLTSSWFTELGEQIPRANLSVHLCGEFSRAFMRGERMFEFDRLAVAFGRAQLNGFSQLATSYIDSLAFERRKHPLFETISRFPSVEFICQVAFPAASWLVEQIRWAQVGAITMLVDPSGGNGQSIIDAGITKIGYSDPVLPVGYAGGIGLHNVVEAVATIAEEKPGRNFWIDMESSLRVPGDNKRFSIDTAHEVLAACEPYVNRSLCIYLGCKKPATVWSLKGGTCPEHFVNSGYR